MYTLSSYKITSTLFIIRLLPHAKVCSLSPFLCWCFVTLSNKLCTYFLFLNVIMLLYLLVFFFNNRNWVRYCKVTVYLDLLILFAYTSFQLDFGKFSHEPKVMLSIFIGELNGINVVAACMNDVNILHKPISAQNRVI